jgi:predicted amidohydrolase
VAGLAERRGDRLYNAAVYLGPEGVRAVYRKVYLFDREQESFDPGDEPFRVHRLGQARLGILVCFDWMFPEAARSLALQGADILVHPANLVLPHGPSAMLTRALENGVFTATANRVGLERVTVTRARHPLHGQHLEVLRAGKEYISVRHLDGGPMAIPRAWTDADGVTFGVAAERPPAIFDVDAFRALVELLEALQRRI